MAFTTAKLVVLLCSAMAKMDGKMKMENLHCATLAGIRAAANGLTKGGNVMVEPHKPLPHQNEDLMTGMYPFSGACLIGISVGVSLQLLLVKPEANTFSNSQEGIATATLSRDSAIPSKQIKYQAGHVLDVEKLPYDDQLAKFIGQPSLLQEFLVTLEPGQSPKVVAALLDKIHGNPYIFWDFMMASSDFSRLVTTKHKEQIAAMCSKNCKLAHATYAKNYSNRNTEEALLFELEIIKSSRCESLVDIFRKYISSGQWEKARKIANEVNTDLLAAQKTEILNLQPNQDSDLYSLLLLRWGDDLDLTSLNLAGKSTISFKALNEIIQSEATSAEEINVNNAGLILAHGDDNATYSFAESLVRHEKRDAFDKYFNSDAYAALPQMARDTFTKQYVEQVSSMNRDFSTCLENYIPKISDEKIREEMKSRTLMDFAKQSPQLALQYSQEGTLSEKDAAILHSEALKWSRP